MSANHNMRKAHKAVMKARAMGILWKLVMQIILDRPSAIVNAWNKLDKRAGACPAKIFFCTKCGHIANKLDTDGKCGRCAPLSNLSK